MLGTRGNFTYYISVYQVAVEGTVIFGQGEWKKSQERSVWGEGRGVSAEGGEKKQTHVLHCSYEHLNPLCSSFYLE